ncbi:MAG: cysteine--tRNA ligase [Candidatus Ryanbacteria bacterium CG10_big_fil_rev_8_21_14_0_10_43_42]|uniref:Cysteine--tRNA ligase n=1 Tax=Candidatus Ryanbacteria bacterium CG10_big_fil_rev_8_21_14_0_10_43_42 TaxID=1974864 RepID=A0A2M8KW30_9BACT|nr:MAG: cysteine--tRNA ligase [Candidatus Ryanbacteria bacterium CG10_big_fil_rev_8_21_14_0_10_43_42]
MPLTIYNTLIRKKEIFKPLQKGSVGLYTCGPTVYNYAHIGNLRTYIFEDILKRTLKANGYTVKHVMNITDVGHLTSDEDTGEDKVEQEARKQKKTASDIARMYENAFKQDNEDLNILPPQIWCRATEHITEQINLIQTLEKKGFTYKTSDGIYFDTSRFPDYGILAKKNIAGIQPGMRVNEREKKNPTDFALWKFSPKEEKRQMEWESPWGIGFPGWHIECSAMSMKYLGTSFDIHCGGIDHIQIHHTNEIAQSEAATGKELARYWLHGEFLELKDGKMAKSEGTGITLATLKEKGFDPLDFRLLVLGTHYRTKLRFSWEALQAARTERLRLVNFYRWLKDEWNTSPQKETVDYKKYRDEFLHSINNDLNVPSALSTVWNLIHDYWRSGAGNNYEDIIKILDEFDSILGLKIKDSQLEIPQNIKALQKERDIARETKNWEEADQLRLKINEAGWDVSDRTDGSFVYPTFGS